MFHYHPLLDGEGLFASTRRPAQRVVFWRDPRTKLVSTLAYHRRGSEPWAMRDERLVRAPVCHGTAEELCHALQLGGRACKYLLVAKPERAALRVVPAVRRVLCERLTDEARPLTVVLRETRNMTDALLISGAVTAFDTLEMALAVDGIRSRGDSGTELLLQLDAVMRDFPSAADSLVEFLAKGSVRAFRRRVRANAGVLKKKLLTLDMSTGPSTYRLFDTVLAKHASSRTFEAAAVTKLFELLCRQRDADLRALLSPALDLLRVDMCDPLRPAR